MPTDFFWTVYTSLKSFTAKSAEHFFKLNLRLLSSWRFKSSGMVKIVDLLLFAFQTSNKELFMHYLCSFLFISEKNVVPVIVKREPQNPKCLFYSCNVCGAKNLYPEKKYLTLCWIHNFKSQLIRKIFSVPINTLITTNFQIVY